MNMKKTILTALAATTCIMTMNAQPKLSANNIDEVIEAMTLDEKARLLVGGANNFFGSQAVVGGEADLVAGAAGTSPAIPRLGIPATVLTDGPAGVRIDPTRKGTAKTYYATGFPIGGSAGALARICGGRGRPRSHWHRAPESATRPRSTAATSSSDRA